jgi:hypothetical protein
MLFVYIYAQSLIVDFTYVLARQLRSHQDHFRLHPTPARSCTNLTIAAGFRKPLAHLGQSAKLRSPCWGERNRVHEGGRRMGLLGLLGKEPLRFRWQLQVSRCRVVMRSSVARSIWSLPRCCSPRCSFEASNWRWFLMLPIYIKN